MGAIYRNENRLTKISLSLYVYSDLHSHFLFNFFSGFDFIGYKKNILQKDEYFIPLLNDKISPN